MDSDLGLAWLTSTDLFALAMCIMLFLIGAKMKSFPFCAASAVGFIAVGLQIFVASEDPIIFMMMFAISAAEVLYGAKFKGW